ncbi:MAG: hypothetical protein B7Z40_17030 [Bosea sp. 12-68-7]|nr:MAG: hypothetical protein B7Z40_17030 [Bosea sp. 12-68-7]
MPNELREVVRGCPVTLPINGESVTVTVSGKVYVSLRTKRAREAKDRFQIALNRLAACGDSLRPACPSGASTMSRATRCVLSGGQAARTVRLLKDRSGEPMRLDPTIGAFDNQRQ